MVYRLYKQLKVASTKYLVSSFVSGSLPFKQPLILSATLKEVFLTSTALISSARASNKFIGAKSGQTWSLLLPLTHVAAVNVIVRSMELGTTPIDLRNFEGEFPKADYTAIVPTQLFRALNGDQQLLSHLQSAKAVLVGGAALSQTLRKQAELAGVKIVTTYGRT